ncbi:tRNA isopentenyltransferase [Thraustotheca clavata]|uniref:tRNA isopentenyltransferase n=1 Tax=Thraustotheca clavata TaxID=74557 RepID=A0A1W0A9P9_9STRA|nr:tRNA isopentenyltransferase [Thraustotheca clavata]
MTSKLSKIFVVIGTTGAGKTKLSIDLAKAINGEIVNSDAMQMYRGLDVATAKATKEEMEGVPHHLLSCIEPVEDCTVVQYKELALNKIHDIISRGKVPVVVGGTMYYTQSLLWKAQLLEEVPGTNGETNNIQLPSSPEEVYEKLKQVDPEMANQLHSKDVRRVQRSLEVFYQTGKKHSEWIAEQKDVSDEKIFNACAFWVDCDRPTLYERLDKRVDKMVENGLVSEIDGLMSTIKDHVEASPTPMGLKGITQAIGFKEFEPYLNAKASGNTDLNAVVNSCIEELKIATRQYAKRQITWIRNRFVPRNIPVYKFDTSVVSQWETLVSTPCLEIASAFLKDDPISYTTCQPDSPGSKKKVKHYCEPCGGREFIGEAQWNEHLRSKGHRFHLKRLRLLASGQLFERTSKKNKATDEDPNTTNN